MTEVVINSCYGGFGLSDQAIEMLFKLKGWTLVKQDRDSGFTMYYKDYIGEDSYFDEYDLERDDPQLVEVVKRLGEKANSRHSTLKVVEIPEGVEWQVEEYDGNEWVAEVHRVWS